MALTLSRRNFYTPNNDKLVGWFRPVGALRPNRERWSSSTPTQAARLFVGFNVGGAPKWGMKDLMDVVREIRIEQGINPASSFVFQKGIYAHEDEGVIVEEDGAQVIVLNVFDTPRREFEQQMRELATGIALALEQEEVIVEYQNSGVAYQIAGYGP